MEKAKVSVIKEKFCKDISKKIMSVLKEKQKQGEYMCSIPAYGYKRNPEVRNKLVIDEKVSYIVEMIFEMYANGHGSVEIVNYLNTIISEIQSKIRNLLYLIKYIK